MKKAKDKQVLVAADFAGFPLKEYVVAHLKKNGWEVTDIGVLSEDEKDPEMFHRIGLKAGARITEKEFEKALLFCGTGMGIHLAASKCPGVHCAVVESVPAALRATTGNGVNVMAMGAFYVAPWSGVEIAEAFLYHDIGDGYENWNNFKEFHQLAVDELNAFDYEAFKSNGFEITKLGEVELGPWPQNSGPWSE